MTKRPLRPRRHAVGLDWRWGALALLAAAVVASAVVVILEYVPNLVRGAPVAIGEAAPTFVLESSRGDRIDLTTYVGRRPVLLVFHGGYQCTMCRVQLRKLRRELGRIRNLGTEVLAISDDPVIDANRIAAELGHEILILADRTRWVGHRYGMRDPERRFTLTGYVIIDRAGNVRVRRLDSLFGEHADEIVKGLEEAARSTAGQR